MIKASPETNPIKNISKKRRISTASLKIPAILLTVILFFPLQDRFGSESGDSLEEIRKSVVQIRVFSQSKDSYSPWQPGPVSGSTGTGFLIGNDRILTNAHVVSQSKFMEGQRNNQTEWFELETEFIAHDCDLAILKAKNPIFYKDASPLSFGDLPELGSPVQVIGYPIGGSKISISRGVVSRIEQSVYAHSQIDSHLVVQVDAAINPGNSGGPAIQNGKVVGVAFQAASKGENIGYIIPTIVVSHFLKDIEDGKYDGYVELGIRTHNSFSLAERTLRQIPENVEGVFVHHVLPDGSASGFLLPNDLLVSIDGFPIGRNGTVAFGNDTRVDFIELVDNKFAGEPISFEIIRKGALTKVSFPAKKMESLDYLRYRYEFTYPHFVFGGLVFQPMSRDLLDSWGKVGQTQGGSQFLYHFQSFLELKKENQEFVVLYRKLNHPINSSIDYFLNSIVTHVNGNRIYSLADFAKEIRNSQGKFILLQFQDIQIPLVLSREEALAADKEIAKSYSISVSYE